MTQDYTKLFAAMITQSQEMARAFQPALESFNAAGLDRALAFKDRLHLFGSISLAASEAFSLKNLNRDRAGQIEAMRKQTAAHIAGGVTRFAVRAPLAEGVDLCLFDDEAETRAAMTRQGEDETAPRMPEDVVLAAALIDPAGASRT